MSSGLAVAVGLICLGTRLSFDKRRVAFSGDVSTFGRVAHPVPVLDNLGDVAGAAGFKKVVISETISSVLNEVVPWMTSCVAACDVPA